MRTNQSRQQAGQQLSSGLGQLGTGRNEMDFLVSSLLESVGFGVLKFGLFD